MKSNSRMKLKGGANQINPGNNNQAGNLGGPPPLNNNGPPKPPTNNSNSLPPLNTGAPPTNNAVPPPTNNAPPPPSNNLGQPPNNSPPPTNNAAPPPVNNVPPPANNVPANNNKGNNKPSFTNTVTAGVSSAINKTSNISNSIKGKASNLIDRGSAQVGKFSDKLSAEWVQKPIMIIILGAIFYGILVLLKKLLFSYRDIRKISYDLLPGTKGGKHASNISNDLIKRSEDKNGMEFTYSFWICIMDLSTYQVGEWKHIMHKGSSSSFPNRAPGVWLHPTKNSIRVYMNTFENPLAYTDVDDIPVKKWVNIQLILQNVNSHTEDNEELVEEKRNQVLDIYINGKNKQSMLFDSIPRQNNGDLYMNLFGGFDGYFSKLKYFPYAVDFNETSKLVKEGPASIETVDTGELPPYLNDTWWFNFKPGE